MCPKPSQLGRADARLSVMGLTEATAPSCVDASASPTDGPKSGRQDEKLGRAAAGWPKDNDAG